MKRSIFILLAGSTVLLSMQRADATAFHGAADPTADKQSMRAIATEMPSFPQAVIQTGVSEGLVRILVSVDSQGVLTDWLVVGYTNRLLADEAVRVLEKWKFEPMVLNGQPMACQSEIIFNFQVQGVVISMNPADHIQDLMANRKEPLIYRPSRLQELDGIPRPVIADPPIYPTEFEEKGIRGAVTVEFYIDESGTVRMPAVVKADYLELGTLAIEAVRNWRFERPTVHGQPTLTRVQQQFNFKGNPSVAQANQ